MSFIILMKNFFNIENVFRLQTTVYRFKVYRVGTAKEAIRALNLYKKDLDKKEIKVMSSYQKRLKDIKELKAKSKELANFQIVVKQYILAKAENNKRYADQCLRAIKNKLISNITSKDEIKKIEIVLEKVNDYEY